MPSLLFGWAYGRITGVENLARFLILGHPGQVILSPYLDILLVSIDRQIVGWDTRQLVVEAVRGVGGCKSEGYPGSEKKSIGPPMKYSKQSPMYIAQMVATDLQLPLPAFGALQFSVAP